MSKIVFDSDGLIKMAKSGVLEDNVVKIIKKMRGKMSAATIWNFLNIYNKELMKTCGIENVECFDLASAIPHNDLYFYDTAHFTERGAELVAEKVAEFLKGSDKGLKS